MKYKAPAKNVQINNNWSEYKETITWDLVEDAKSYIIYGVYDDGEYECKIGEVGSDSNSYVIDNSNYHYDNVVVMPQ